MPIVAIVPAVPGDGGPDGTSRPIDRGTPAIVSRFTGDRRLEARDESLLLHLARCRLLSFAQIRELAFPGRHKSILGRRLDRLAQAGWIDRWYEPVPSGGRPGYALLTAQGLQWADARIRSEVSGTPWEHLVTAMLPASARRRLVLPPGRVPPFLEHQREINALLVAWQTRGASPILWASSWDCPFSFETGGFPWPQPDFVLVRENEDGPEVVFGELDRGHEPVAVFVQRKVLPYALLTSMPDLLETILGLSRVTVWVAVLDVRRKQPRARLMKLAKAACEQGAGEVLHFALAGEVFARPELSLWRCAAEIVADAGGGGAPVHKR